MTNRFIGTFFVLFGSIVLYLALSLPQPLTATRIAYGPGFFPKILGAVILLCGLLMAIKGRDFTDDEDHSRQLGDWSQYTRLVIVITLTTIYIWFSDEIGFLILAPFILFVLLMIGRVSFIQSLLISIVAPIIIYGLFAKLLLVPLPLGLLSPFGAYL